MLLPTPLNEFTPSRLKTALPGPRSQALMEERRRQVARGPFHVTPIFASSAKGALLEDVDGNQLIDFAAGIGVVNVGHCDDTVVKAIQRQAAQVIHTSFNVTPHESYIELAKRLNAATPGSFAKKTFLANSGAEAVENAIKIARAHTGRPGVVCFEHGFHGRTFMAMTLTSKEKPYKTGFAPFCSDVYRAPFPDTYRWPDAEKIGAEGISRECFEQFRKTIPDPKQIAAVIIEPVLGEGGFLSAPVSFLQAVQGYCRENGIVFIADEIQTGFGRTGSLFASEQLGIEPDLMILAKGLGGGFPISAVVGRAEIMDAPVEGGIGGTYGGNPVACAAALAVLELFERDNRDLLRKARAIAETVQARLARWHEDYPQVGNVRGLGPMQAFELVKDRATKEADKDAAGRLIRHAYENGLIIMSSGTYGNVVRLLVPLVISYEQLKEGLDIIEAGLKAGK